MRTEVKFLLLDGGTAMRVYEGAPLSPGDTLLWAPPRPTKIPRGYYKVVARGMMFAGGPEPTYMMVVRWAHPYTEGSEWY